jgi:hypothetical protein
MRYSKLIPALILFCAPLFSSLRAQEDEELEKQIEEEINNELKKEFGETEEETQQKTTENDTLNINAANEYRRDRDFALMIPDGWKTRRVGGELRIEKNPQTYLGIQTQIKETGARSALDGFLAFVKTRIDGFKNGSFSPVTVNGVTGMSSNFTYAGTEGTITMLARHRYAYSLWAQAPTGQFSQTRPVFERMVESFTIPDMNDIPELGNWPEHKSPHFYFHYLKESEAQKGISKIIDEYEAAFASITGIVGNLDSRIDIYFYPSKDLLYTATRRSAGFAMNPEKEIHSYYGSWNNRQSSGHELTHILSSWRLGEPSEALLGEGIAVWLDQSGKDLHKMTSGYLQAGRLPAIASFIGDNWFKINSEIAYSASGSFVKFLSDTYGVENLKRIYSVKDFTNACPTNFGKTISQLEQEWHQVLKQSE